MRLQKAEGCLGGKPAAEETESLTISSTSDWSPCSVCGGGRRGFAIEEAQEGFEKDEEGRGGRVIALF